MFKTKQKKIQFVHYLVSNKAEEHCNRLHENLARITCSLNQMPGLKLGYMQAFCIVVAYHLKTGADFKLKAFGFHAQIYSCSWLVT